MSKKKFSSGLDILFDSNNGGEVKEDTGFLSIAEDEKEGKVTATLTKKKKKKGKSSKNFTSDLDSLFEVVIEESINEKIAAAKSENEVEEKGELSRRIQKRPRKPLKGLNALIRATLDDDMMEFELAKKRVSFTYDKKQYAKLKAIAKEQNVFLKDIIGEILSEYINQYLRR